MFGYFKRRKAAKELFLATFEEQKRFERELELANANAEIYRDEQTMLSKQCPINNGICYKKCAHFQEGNVTGIDFGSYIGFQIYKRMPCCKLWCNK